MNLPENFYKILIYQNLKKKIKNECIRKRILRQFQKSDEKSLVLQIGTSKSDLALPSNEVNWQPRTNYDARNPYSISRKV